jgi:hypothetical protein
MKKKYIFVEKLDEKSHKTSSVVANTWRNTSHTMLKKHGIISHIVCVQVGSGKGDNTLQFHCISCSISLFDLPDLDFMRESVLF